MTWLAKEQKTGLNNDLQSSILQKLVYIGSRTWNVDPVIEHDNLRFRFDVFKANKLPSRTLLDAGDLGDAVIAILCADDTQPDVVKDILRRIKDAGKDEQADALAQLLVLSKLRGAHGP